MEEKMYGVMLENARLTVAFELLREIVERELKTDSKAKYIDLDDLNLVLLAAGIEIKGEIEVM